MDELFNPVLKSISDGSLLTATALAIFVFFYKLWRILREDTSRDAKTDEQEMLVEGLFKENADLRAEIHALHREMQTAMNEKLRQDVKLIQYEQYIVTLRGMALRCQNDCPLLPALNDKPEISIARLNAHAKPTDS